MDLGGGRFEGTYSVIPCTVSPLDAFIGHRLREIQRLQSNSEVPHKASQGSVLCVYTAQGVCVCRVGAANLRRVVTLSDDMRKRKLIWL